MKTKIFSILSSLLLVFLATSCHDPETLESNGDPHGILSMTAWMVGDDSSENSFTADIDYDAHTITVVFPLNYPRPSDELFQEEWMENVRLRAALATNATIEPGLSTMDLRKTNTITVTNAQKQKTVYTVRGEIRPSNECELKELELEDGTAGIVDNVNHIVYLIADDNIGLQTATYEISYHATVEPDIAVEPFDFDNEEATITVIAQNGVDKQEYSLVKGRPERLPYGIRPGSAKLMWTRKLSDLGCKYKPAGAPGEGEVPQNGIAVTDNYVVINEEGTMQAVVLNARTGKDTGKRLDMSIIPAGYNHSMTSDNAGHILVNSNHNQGQFTVWAFDGIEDTGKQIYSAGVWGGGNRLSVMGDITTHAVANGSMNGTGISIFRWDIINSEFKNFVQYNITGGMTGTPWTSFDVASTSIEDPKADVYFNASGTFGYADGTYGPGCFDVTKCTYKYRGLPPTIKWETLPSDASNWPMGACDYIEFNKNKYFAYQTIHSQTFGSQNDLLFLLDVTGGTLMENAIDFTANGINVNSNYGAQALGRVGVAGPANDCRLWVSKNGYFMYVYFMFANGSVGCVRVDCIKY